MTSAYRLLLLVSVGVLLALGGCSVPNNDQPRPTRGESYLRIIHASNKAPTLDILARYYNVAQIIKRDFGFLSQFPDSAYLRVESTDPVDEFGYTNLTLEGVKINALTSDTARFVGKKVVQLQPFGRYSVFILNDSGAQKFFVYRDLYPQQDTGKGQVRFVNAVEGNFSLRVESSGATTTTVPFSQATPYIAVPIGVHTFSVLDGGNIVAQLTDVRIQDLFSYTFYMVNNTLHVVRARPTNL